MLKMHLRCVRVRVRGRVGLGMGGGVQGQCVR